MFFFGLIIVVIIVVGLRQLGLASNSLLAEDDLES